MSSAGPDPEQLMRQTRAGDNQALGQLLELYRNYLALLVRMQIGRRLQGKIDHADLVQETFLAAHRDFSMFRGTTEREFVSWLRQILARNLTDVVRHYYGTQRRDVRLERHLEGELNQSSQALGWALVAPQSSPSQQVVRRERAVLLADALKALPDAYGDVIVMHHLEGLSFVEVAQRMGRSKHSIQKLWMRALIQLRQLLRGSL